MKGITIVPRRFITLLGLIKPYIVLISSLQPGGLPLEGESIPYNGMKWWSVGFSRDSRPGKENGRYYWNLWV